MRVVTGRTVRGWVLLALAVVAPGCAVRRGVRGPGEERDRVQPAGWLMRQRLSAGPIPPRALSAAIERAREDGILSDAPGSWVNQGPLNVGGRVTALAVDPVDPNHVWIGTAAGGVWDSFDAGTSWTSRFDAQTTLSIGSLATHPTNPSIVYVGTGEDNGGGYSFDGEGILETTDGGATWTNVGLAETRRIGRIAIDPSNPQRIFAAAGGNWFQKDTNRGIYRSTDGGATWQRVLYVADDTGGIDLAIDPSNPARIYAAMWQRFSAGTSWYVGGTQGGIWRSTDGGTTWTKLTVGLPTTVGRIGLAVAPSQTSTVYACIIGTNGQLQGMYKSTNAGDTWSKVSGSLAPLFFSTYSYYFSRIRVDPSNPNTLYALDVDLLLSTNGGGSYTPIAGAVHVDWHDLRVEAGGRWLAGTDGGFFRSTDAGATWFHAQTLPITQLYDADVAETDPNRRLVGAQDNFVNRTTTGGLSDWIDVIGGDGLQVEIDPTDAMKMYGESQYGNIQRSTDGGNSFVSAVAGIDATERTNWNTPITIDPTLPTTLYTGAERVYRSDDAAVSWTPVSPNLTNVPFGGESRGTGPAPGWRTAERGLDHLEDLIANTITVVSVSPLDRDVVWAGTDDGNVWVTTNGGGSWQHVNPIGAPYWVTDVAPDPFDRDTAYLTVTGYRQGDKLPYLRVTRDLGQTWQDLSAGLPQVPVNTVLADDAWRGRLFVGSDIGVFVSDDFGATFSAMRGGMPWLVVMKLRKHRALDALWAATHARGIFRFDLSQLGPADGDGDGSDNNADCAPADGGAFAAPGEVADVTADRGAAAETLLSWSGLASSAGSGTVYDLARGDIASLLTSGTAASAALACASPATSASDPALPAAGAGFYYLVRGRNTCAIGTWGTGSDGLPRASGACP